MVHNARLAGPHHPRLPRVFVADDGRRQLDPPAGLDCGLLLRDTDLAAVVQQATSAHAPLAIDLDSTGGLDADEAAVDFLVQRLGIRVVLTRRPHLAVRVAELGGLGLLHVLALDSTGLSRSLESHPRIGGVGTVVSPGLVVAHLRPDELLKLPRPTLAYGLIDATEDALAILPKVDAIVVRAPLAARISTLVGAGATPPPAG